MASYTIRDLEKMSGIKAHTIRIWERRYKLIEPKRTPTNIRYYSDEDLKRILNISILSQNGFKISKIALLNEEQLKDRVVDLCIDTNNQNIQIESLIVSMLDMDDKKFSEVITNSIIKQGFESTVETLLFPFLEHIGTLWQAGSIFPAQEHFISNLIRQKLIVAIDSEMSKFKKTGHKIVFFLPEGELHELSLLFYSLIARKENFDVTYLGSSVPLSDLINIESLNSSDYFFTSFTTSLGNEKFTKTLNDLTTYFPGKKIFITGLRFKEPKNKIPDGFKLITSSNEFKQELHMLAQ